MSGAADPGALLDVHVTCPDAATAEAIARAALKARLCACAQIGAPIRSLYHWEGAIAEDEEVPLTLKSRSARFDALAALIARLHPYDLPAMTAHAALRSGQGVREWVAEETRVRDDAPHES